jgi:hypothetical protein
MHVKTRDFRTELILETVIQWIRAEPEAARTFAIEQKEAKQRQRHASGAWRGTKLGYVKYRIPQNLLDCIRVVFHHYGVQEIFGQDDKDMRLLMREFPELFGHTNIYKNPKKRKKTNESSSVQ